MIEEAERSKTKNEVSIVHRTHGTGVYRHVLGQSNASNKYRMVCWMQTDQVSVDGYRQIVVDCCSLGLIVPLDSGYFVM
jgi:hypothetical protein